MSTNDTNIKEQKLIYPELSYYVTGICFDVHNELGRYCKERQYADAIESRLKNEKITFSRELRIAHSGNIIDFIIDDKIVLELKAKPLILKGDFYQIQRYLQDSGLKLGLLVNFRNRYLRPIRTVRIDTDARKRFV